MAVLVVRELPAEKVHVAQGRKVGVRLVVARVASAVLPSKTPSPKAKSQRARSRKMLPDFLTPQ